MRSVLELPPDYRGSRHYSDARLRWQYMYCDGGYMSAPYDTFEAAMESAWKRYHKNNPDSTTAESDKP
jgi:hypothetical protein